jgi:beta-lactam-binding protein with PASTA domain
MSDGETITIIVSTGKSPINVEMPNLIGSTVEEARLALESVGLALGDVFVEISDVFAQGYIMRQEVAQDDAKVDITYSQ